jgi:3-oxoadipate enol-lactonase
MYLKTDQGSVYYEVSGPPEAPVVVFCHGVAMNHRTFASQVEALRDRYQVIVWDLPYHGRSSPIDRRLRFSTTAADFLIALLDTLDSGKAVLAGLSLGSLVVQHTAHHHPHRVKAVVHISNGPLFFRIPAILKAAMPLIRLFARLYQTQAFNHVFAKHKALREETQAYLMETAAHTGKDVVAQLTHEMLRDMVIGLPEHSPHPALIVYGDHEWRFVRRMAKAWHKEHPDSQLVEICDAHHILNQDNPAAFHQVLGPCLEGVEAQQSARETPQSG